MKANKTNIVQFQFHDHTYTSFLIPDTKTDAPSLAAFISLNYVHYTYIVTLYSAMHTFFKKTFFSKIKKSKKSRKIYIQNRKF